jgi:uncharacterized membrane protein YccC
VVAIFVAFDLQLDSPSWAGTSAAIVCQPVLGASLHKGLFRLLGTVLGAVVAVALTAVLPKDRIGFLVGLAARCAVCSFASTVLKNFASYAAMLAGAAAAVIIANSIEGPNQVFTLAAARATEIGLGIV